MKTPEPDARIKFKQTVVLPSLKAFVVASATGGVIITVQGQMFGIDDKPLGGIGGENEDLPIDSISGQAVWEIDVHPDTHYIKWGIRAYRSAGDGGYTAWGRILDAQQNELASGSFGGHVPDGKKNDILIFDGVIVTLPKMVAPTLPGATV